MATITGLYRYHYYKQATDAIKTCLADYSKEVRATLEGAIEDAAEYATTELKKQNNGGRWEKYPKSWTYTKQGSRLGFTYVVHNKKYYSLAHLLEYGHAKRGGGRTKAYPHIAGVNERTAAMLEEEIAQKLSGG